jgi:hypothetical protein
MILPQLQILLMVGRFLLHLFALFDHFLSSQSSFILVSFGIPLKDSFLFIAGRGGLKVVLLLWLLFGRLALSLFLVDRVGLIRAFLLINPTINVVGPAALRCNFNGSFGQNR